MVAAKTGRRQFLAGLLAAGFIPKPSWADAGSPRFLAAAARPDGSYVLCGISADLQVRFALPLPDRGHAAAAHPTRPEAVAFARRPGTFAIVIDCAQGIERAVLSAPAGRHFYGHGAFSADGALLFTTENNYEAGEGRIGVWDTRKGYKRVDEWPSGGVGPHDIKRLQGTERLVVANGGIDTHPDSGRTKLNIATMQPSLTYIENGRVVQDVVLGTAWRKNSIRHLAVAPDGTVAFGMQWQGGDVAPALVGVHHPVKGVRVLDVPLDDVRRMQGYVGSVAFSNDGARIAVTSPRGGVMQVYDAKASRFSHNIAEPDVCGVAAMGQGFAMSSGLGGIRHIDDRIPYATRHSDLQWDNHLVPVVDAFV